MKGEGIASPSLGGINPNVNIGGLGVIAVLAASDSLGVAVRISGGKPIFTRVRDGAGRRRRAMAISAARMVAARTRTTRGGAVVGESILRLFDG